MKDLQVNFKDASQLVTDSANNLASTLGTTNNILDKYIKTFHPDVWFGDILTDGTVDYHKEGFTKDNTTNLMDGALQDTSKVVDWSKVTYYANNLSPKENAYWEKMKSTSAKIMDDVGKLVEYASILEGTPRVGGANNHVYTYGGNTDSGATQTGASNNYSGSMFDQFDDSGMIDAIGDTTDAEKDLQAEIINFRKSVDAGSDKWKEELNGIDDSIDINAQRAYEQAMDTNYQSKLTYGELQSIGDAIDEANEYQDKIVVDLGSIADNTDTISGDIFDANGNLIEFKDLFDDNGQLDVSKVQEILTSSDGKSVANLIQQLANHPGVTAEDLAKAFSPIINITVDGNAVNYYPENGPSEDLTNYILTENGAIPSRSMTSNIDPVTGETIDTLDPAWDEGDSQLNIGTGTSSKPSISEADSKKLINSYKTAQKTRESLWKDYVNVRDNGKLKTAQGIKDSKYFKALNKDQQKVITDLLEKNKKIDLDQMQKKYGITNKTLLDHMKKYNEKYDTAHDLYEEFLKAKAEAENLKQQLEANGITGYARGTTHAKGGLSLVNDGPGNKPEMVVTKRGVLIPLSAGDGVIPADLTANLINLAKGGVLPLNLPNVQAPETNMTSTINTNQNIHFDSLIHVDGNVDQGVVSQLEDIAKGLMSNNGFKRSIYNYTSKEMAKDMKKAGH